MDGLVELFKKMLKFMLGKVTETDVKNCHQLFPYVFFIIREVHQSSTGFSLFNPLVWFVIMGNPQTCQDSMGVAAVKPPLCDLMQVHHVTADG